MITILRDIFMKSEHFLRYLPELSGTRTRKPHAYLPISPNPSVGPLSWRHTLKTPIRGKNVEKMPHINARRVLFVSGLLLREAKRRKIDKDTKAVYSVAKILFRGSQFLLQWCKSANYGPPPRSIRS